jgi:hypothetical protein
LAKPGFRALTLSMSGYGKNPQGPEYNSRPAVQQQYSGLQQTSYGTYPSQSNYATPASSQPAQRSIAATHTPTHPSLPLGEPLYSSRQYAASPRILGYDPHTGTEGTTLTAYLQSAVDLTSDPRSFRLMFGGGRCNATLSKVRSDEYHLSGHVPPFANTGWLAPQMTVYLVIEDEEGQSLGTEEIGSFTYTDAATQSSYSSPPRNSLKRKASVDAGDSRGVVKRTAVPPLRPKSEDYTAYGYPAPSSNHHYTPYASAASNERAYTVYSSYNQPEHSHSGYQPQASPRNFPYPYGAQTEAANQSSAASSQWSSPFPQLPATHSGALTAAADGASLLPSPSETPTLIRTSTLQQASDKGDGTGRAPGFNPYTIYPHKAVLKLQGELTDMANRWTAEEWEAKRRLVQFWRQQKGSTIHATFRPVPQSDRPSSAVCVSCIWWAEKNECYVTSVDCISLLESLIAVRFTVEEKNRIRRNLEGFRPLTVSKGKKECENFFKLIMGFPSPKPRNIEKDVKVFPWSVLPHALKKIIGKYSASYSSTASIIPPTPGASPYPGAPPPQQSPRQRPTENLPPRTVSSPTGADPSTSNGTPSSLSATTAAIPIPGSSSSTSLNRNVSESHISLPNIVPSANAHTMWPLQPLQPLPSAQSLNPMSARRLSWDTSPYLEANSSSGPSYYARDPHAGPDERTPVSGAGAGAGPHVPQHATSNV